MRLYVFMFLANLLYCMLMKTIAIGNQKGGVGKTATVQNLGAVLSLEFDQRVVLLDMDPQHSLTDACGVTTEHGSIAQVIGGDVALDQILVEAGSGMAIAPADLALAEVEAQLFSKIGRENKLKRALPVLDGHFDYCLIDCPPSLSLMTVNALAASDAVLVPCVPQMVDVRGLLLFFDGTIHDIRAEINPSLEILGVLPTFYDSRLVHHTAVLQELKNANLPVLPMAIGRSIRIAEAAAAGDSILEYDPENKQLDNYRELARMVMNG